MYSEKKTYSVKKLKYYNSGYKVSKALYLQVFWVNGKVSVLDTIRKQTKLLWTHGVT